ncbi:protein kinase [Nonomuraea sp. NPDC048916]|uniref:serine/threonine protein kinase n=1 Tax=Nonomuraea sp. NPDC048916 TaxID=3154232 RepID=UPI0033F7267A
MFLLARTVSGFFTAGVVDADPEGDPPWLATAYVPGLSLDQAVAEHGPWQEKAVLALGAGLAEALDSIHAVGVVHRDLKPSNVLLAADGPRVIDFGISVAVEGSRLTRTGMAVGTPGFISPEQLTGALVGPPSDVFCLGAVLAFTASATGPFGSGSWQGLWYRTVREEPDLAALPPRLRSIVSWCLEKSPERRPTAAVLLDELAESATDGGTLVELYTESGWLPEPVAHVVRTLVATPAPRPPADPGDSAPRPPATVAESPDGGSEVPQPPSSMAPSSRNDLPTPPAEEPEHGDVDRPLAPGDSDQRTLIDGTSRTPTVIERTASLPSPAQQDVTSSSPRPPAAGPPSRGRAMGSGLRRIRDRLIFGVTLVSPVVLLGIVYVHNVETSLETPVSANRHTVVPTTGSPEQPRVGKSPPFVVKSPAAKSPAKVRFSSPIDFCALLKAGQVRELVPRAHERADTESGGCNWASRGRALDVTPQAPDWDAPRWFPSTKAAKKELRDWKRVTADGDEIVWGRWNIGVDRVFKSVVSGKRSVPGVGQEAFTHDAGPDTGGVHYSEVMFRLDNLVIEVRYTVVDGSEYDQRIRQGALRAARWVEAALDRQA